MVLDGSRQEDDTLPQQAGINVEATLAPAGVLDHLRDEVVRVNVERILILHLLYLEIVSVGVRLRSGYMSRISAAQ